MLWSDRFALIVLVFLTAPAEPVFGQVQHYPDRAVTIVVPTAAGGLPDAIARLLATKLEQRHGTIFAVENKAGAGQVVGTAAVARAAPDGYTMLVVSNAAMAANVTLFKSLPYDPTTDLAPIALIMRAPQVLVVNADLPIHSLADLVRLAKASPGGLTFASSGPGTSQHLCGEWLKTALDIELTHIPYKGSAPALNDVAGNHVALMFSDILNALPLVQAGKLRMLGVSTAQRVDAIPDVPPLAEIGAPGFDAAAWFMVVAPGKTPPEILSTLYVEIRAVMSDAAVRDEFIRRGVIPVDSPSPDELKLFIRSEIVRWGEIIRKAGVAGSM